MADTDGGRNYDSEISSLRSQINRLESEVNGLNNNVRQLEQDMRDLAMSVVNAIDKQTSVISERLGDQTKAILGGVVANTAMLELTKRQLSTDFEQTRTKLDLQTEADLQIEVGKKIGESVAVLGKITAFKSEIESRFDKSIEGIFLNRQLYNEHFQKIYDEYDNKLRTIGSHIFRIWEEDIALAEEAGSAPPQQMYALPLEVDLYRVKVRQESLEDSLDLLRLSRLDEILQSTQVLEGALKQRFGIGLPSETSDGELEVLGYGCVSGAGASVFVDLEAQSIQSAEQPLKLLAPRAEFSAYSSPDAGKKVRTAFERANAVEAKPEEIVRLLAAADRLREKKLISDEGYQLIEDFLGQGQLQIAGG